MTLGVTFAFLHFVALFGIVGTLVFEWLTMSRAPTWAEARRIQQADRWYGIFAMLLIAAGFVRVFYFEKGADFYFGNSFFKLKLALFLILGLISIYPTIKFIGWRRETRQQLPPVVSEAEFGLLSKLLSLELIVLAGVALCASLMARGVSL